MNILLTMAVVTVFSPEFMIAAFSPNYLNHQRHDGRRAGHICSRATRASQSFRMASLTNYDDPMRRGRGDDQRSEEEEDSSNDMLQRIQRSFRRFDWQHQNRTYHINYRVEQPRSTTGPSQPLLLVHGFGANLNHFRHNIPVLQNAGYRVYAVDLLGFGASEKATDVEYSIDLFVQLLHDFVHEMNALYDNDPYQQRRHRDRHQDDPVPWMVAGNSIGGLCCLGLAKALPDKIQGVVLLNCATGMSGFRYADIPIIVRPLLYVVQNFVLKGNVGQHFFEQFRHRDNIQRILLHGGVYRNTRHVNAELLEILLGPSDDVNAAHVFCNVMGGEPGPRPEHYLTQVPCPVLALWGDKDPWVAHDRARDWHALHNDFRLQVLPDTGHCPHDDRPELVHNAMIPWMQQVVQRYDPQKHAFIPSAATATEELKQEQEEPFSAKSDDDIASFLESAMEGIADMIFDPLNQQQHEDDEEEEDTDGKDAS